MALHAYQFNFRQVEACVTTCRKPWRLWTEKNCKRTLSSLLQAAKGCADLHMVQWDDRDVRDNPIATDLRQILIDMIPISGQANAEGESLCETCSPNSSVGSLAHIDLPA